MDAIERICIDYANVPRIVADQVTQLLPPSVNRDDVEPAAWEGLFMAARTWRPDGGAPLKQWVFWRVRYAVISEVRRTSRLTRPKIRQAQIVDAAVADLTNRMRRAPTPAEVAAETGLTVDELDVLAYARYQARRPVYIDESEEPLAIAAAPMLDPDRADPYLLGWVRAAVAALDDRTRYVITELYWNDASTGQLGDELGVTASRVSQIKSETTTAIGDAIWFNVRGDPGIDVGTGIVSRRRDAYRAAVADQYRHMQEDRAATAA